MRLFKRNRRRSRGAAASRPARTRTVLRMETLEDRLAPAGLNPLIDSILAARYASNPQSFPATFSSHINSATVGATLNGGGGLRVTDVDLSFFKVTGQPGARAGKVT